MECSGAPTRTRTADLLITNYMAYVFMGFYGLSFYMCSHFILIFVYLQ